MKNILKKIIAVNLITIITLMNFNFLGMSEVIATAEEGKFKSSEIPYNLSIIKAGNYTNTYLDRYATMGESSIYLDSEGRLWKIYNSELNQILNEYKFSDIAVGKEHNIAIDQEGYLWGWGDNTYGQLGNGTTINSSTPISIFPTKRFKYITCSNYASFAIDYEGRLYAWGSCKFAETQRYNKTIEEVISGSATGTSDKINNINIQTIPENILKDYKFKKVVASQNSVIAIDSEGYAWGWGENICGHVGNYNLNSSKYLNFSSSGYASEIKYLKDATKISTTKKFIEVSIGYNHSVLIDEEGKVYTLGSCENGALGDGILDSIYKTDLIQPIYTENLKFKDVIAGYNFTGFIDNDSNVWMCGSNALGCIGNGTNADTATIVKIKTEDVIFTQFLNDTASRSIQIIDSDGNLWGWGLTNQLVGSDTESINIPIQITENIKEFTVTFKNGNTVEKTETVQKGESATAPELTKAGYSLSWDTEFDNVTSDLEVNAVWTANENTAYKVIHHFRNLDTEVEGFIDEEEQKTGTTDTQAVAEYKTKEGFTKNEADTRTVKQGNIAGDGSLVLHLYYTRNTYDITYELNGGTPTGSLSNKYTYGKEMILPNRVEKQGYTFAGWYDNEELTGSPVTAIPVGATGEKTFYAKWDAKGDTAYKVQHYKQKQDLSGYELAEEEAKTGVTGAKVNAVPKIYSGYEQNMTHSERKAEGTIAANGSLTLKLYYDRSEFTVTFKNGNTVEKTETVQKGESATAPELTKAGYSLSWDTEFDNVTSDLEVNAVWSANENTAYKVEHYIRNLDTEIEGYTLKEVENKTGTTGTRATAIYKEYEGFTKNETYRGKVESGNIEGDGSLVLKLYYNRNVYNINYELNGGTPTGSLSNKYIYGKEMILPNRVEKQGYTFAGWYDNEELTGSPVTTIPATATGNKTFYAKWVEKDKEYYILSERYSIDLEGKTITKVSPETTVENFLNKIETNGTCKVLNAKGKEVNKTELVGTGYKLQVTFKGQVYTYEIAVRGDIDGNGKLTITDLSMLNQALMEKVTLTGIKEKAANINYTDGITITDLSMLNQALMEKITL